MVRVWRGLISRSANLRFKHLNHHFVKLVLKAVRLLVQQDLYLQIFDFILDLCDCFLVSGLFFLSSLRMSSEFFAVISLWPTVAEQYIFVDTSLKHFKAIWHIAFPLLHGCGIYGGLGRSTVIVNGMFKLRESDGLGEERVGFSPHVVYILLFLLVRLDN